MQINSNTKSLELTDNDFLPSCGVIYICTGPQFTAASVKSALSVRANSPNLMIDIYTDTPSAVPDGVFDIIHLIDNPHRRSKVDYIAETRFDRTLYLDSDTRVVTDISEAFGLLERFDLALAHAHSRNNKANVEYWRHILPDSFPQLNGGVILFRKIPAVLNLFNDWKNAFHEAGFNKDQTTLRELLWLSDLRLHVLPPEYNLRYARYLKVWSSEEARPKIQHFASYHHEVGLIQGLRGWRRQLQKIKNKFDAKKRKNERKTSRSQVGRLKPDRPQIFCIGFHKTGTTSLAAALQLLGYRTIHGDGRGLYSGADEGRTLIKQLDGGDFDLSTLPLFDAFLDNPYFSVWRQLAERHPYARFILTQRDPSAWIESCFRYYAGRRARPMREWMFGSHADPASSPEAKERWLETFNKHNSDIISYFKDSPNFMIMDITNGDGWDKLCAFLNEKVPQRPFPILNRTR